MRRRQFLKTAGATALGAGVLSGVAAAEHYDVQPDHVSISYDQDYLEQYCPELVFSADARQKFLDLFGWVARSPEYDTDVCVYWADYSHQEGLIGNLDSHYGDTEPLQVEVNSETGEVERVRASIYHWIKGEGTASEVSMKDGRPHLQVVDPWHQYTAAAAAGIVPEVEDLTAVFEDWLDDGLEESLHPGSSTNPWVMQTRDSWWREASFSILGTEIATWPSTDEMIVSAYKMAGIGQVGSLED